MQILKTIHNNTEQSTITNGKANSTRQISTDKKLRLIQSIRAENMDNRMKIRQRENFLYGNNMNNMPPLLNKGESMYMGDPYRDAENPEEVTHVTNTFKVRMAAAIILFVAFLLCDVGNYKVWGYSMNDICGLISEDYFRIYADKTADELPQLTELLQLDD